jgi:hypothetical protein
MKDHIEMTGFDLDALGNCAYFDFHNEFNRLVGIRDMRSLGAGAEFDNYRNEYTIAVATWSKDQGTVLQNMVWDIVEQRNDLLVGLNDVIKGLRNHYENNIRRSAGWLESVMNEMNYEKIVKMKMEAQYELIVILIQKLEDQLQKNSEIFGETDLTAWVREINRWNENFIKVTQIPTYESENKKDVEMDRIRNELDETFQTLIGKLCGLTKTEPPTTNKEFIRAINKLINKYTVYEIKKEENSCLV